MNKRDEAARAGLRSSWAAWVEREGSDYSWPDEWDDLEPEMQEVHVTYALIEIDAALKVLQPTVPNTVEALKSLPIGTVIRGIDYGGEPWVNWQLWQGVWYDGESKREDSLLVHLSPTLGIDEWQVIYMPEDAS